MHRNARWEGRRGRRRRRRHIPDLEERALFTFEGKLPTGYVNEMRAVLDRALTAGQAALAADNLKPFTRSWIERDMAIISKARAGEPLDVLLSQDLWTRDRRPLHEPRRRFGSAPNIEKSAKRTRC